MSRIILNFLFLFFALIIFESGFSQKKKYLFFDQNWQLSASQSSQYYECECHILPSGALEGPFNCFILNEDILVKSYNYSNNILHGEVQEFFENGELKIHAFYKKGLPIKEWKEWDRSGELIVDKVFDENSVFVSDKNVRSKSDYEKVYFGNKEFQAPVYSTECIRKNRETPRYECSERALLEYYKHPPLPPFYFDRVGFKDKIVYVKLKYRLNAKGKIDKTKILETSKDAYLDELAEIHVMNMIPFETAKSHSNPINYWIEAIIEFNFKL